VKPPLCARCGNPVAWPVARCRECAGRRLAFASARAAVAYEGAVPRLVGAWKDGGRRRLARLAGELIVEHLAKPEGEAITCVPSVRARELWRGANPAGQLACELGRRWRLPVRALLVRNRSPAPQRGLPLVERRRNVADAFRATRAVPATVVLVDDVYTSGSTVHAAARALARAGADRIEVVTFARALRLQALRSRGGRLE
jgi:predicted amidophosphoribosyltransferase